MADNTRSSWATFLFDMQGAVQNVFPTEAPFLAELSGVGDSQSVGRYTRAMDGNRGVFSGQQVRHGIVTAPLPAGGWVNETQTWNVAQALPSQKVLIALTDLVQPFTVSVDVERDSFDNANASAVATLIDQARIQLARLENITFLGDGTGRVSDIASGTSPGLAINVSTTGAGPMDVLLPGTVWDVLTKSTGANPGNGLRRLIASVSDSATTQTVTFDTNAQASDGNSGNITFSTSEGIYIPGTPAAAITTPGSIVAQGLEQAAATSGTFEGLAKGTVTQWQGTDGRAGDTSPLPLSSTMMDGAVRRGRRAAIGIWDFGIGDPAAIDLYKQGLQAQVRYDAGTLTLHSGYKGIAYDGADKPFPLIKEPVHKKAGLKLIDKGSFQLYGDKVGPAFLDDDGGMFRRFNRTLVKEADLLDRVQLGVTKCNTIVFLNNLAVAS
jgi:hypothetical protein